MVPTKTVRKKNTLLVIIGTVGVASLFFFYSRQDESFWLKPVIVAKELVRMAQPGYAIYTSGCKIPAFDPFHWTVAGLYRKQTLYVCPGKPSFIRLAANVPSIDARVLWEHHKYKPRDVLCTYQKITRDENRTEPDSAVVYHPSSKLILRNSPVQRFRVRDVFQLRRQVPRRVPDGARAERTSRAALQTRRVRGESAAQPHERTSKCCDHWPRFRLSP
ncbi:hypothetical protein MTO96_028961 [Rhipicephalus appendiculatus]